MLALDNSQEHPGGLKKTQSLDELISTARLCTSKKKSQRVMLESIPIGSMWLVYLPVYFYDKNQLKVNMRYVHGMGYLPFTFISDDPSFRKPVP